MSVWENCQKWEQNWWGNCANMVGEEMKQLAHVQCLGLEFSPTHKTKYEIDMEGKSVLDLGGGPASLLLKCVNVVGVVADPCEYPDWVYQRYKTANIEFVRRKGEDLSGEIPFDEVWIYNVLQHVEEPEKVAKNALKIGKIVRVSEFPFTKALPEHGHPNCLQPEDLDRWFGGEGKVELVNEFGMNGQIYHGIFKGDRYGK